MGHNRMIKQETLVNWFKKAEEDISAIDETVLKDPERVFNLDESGFKLDATTGRVLSYVGSKIVFHIRSENRTLITCITCCKLFYRPDDYFPKDKACFISS